MKNQNVNKEVEKDVSGLWGMLGSHWIYKMLSTNIQYPDVTKSSVTPPFHKDHAWILVIRLILLGFCCSWKKEFGGAGRVQVAHQISEPMFNLRFQKTRNLRESTDLSVPKIFQIMSQEINISKHLKTPFLYFFFCESYPQHPSQILFLPISLGNWEAEVYQAQTYWCLSSWSRMKSKSFKITIATTNEYYNHRTPDHDTHIVQRLASTRQKKGTRKMKGVRVIISQPVSNPQHRAAIPW